MVGGRRKALLEGLICFSFAWLFFHYPDKKQLWRQRVYLGHDYEVQSVMTVMTGKSWRHEVEATAHTASTAGNQRTRNAGVAPSLLSVQFSTEAQGMLTIYLIKIIPHRHDQRLTQPHGHGQKLTKPRQPHIGMGRG